MTSGYSFYNRQPIDPRTIISKGNNVCDINLLALLNQNKDIVDVMNSSLCINFD